MSKQLLPNSLQQNDVLDWIVQFQNKQDDSAQTYLVNFYKHLVESIARKYAHGKSDYEDIVQVGMLGLLGAIRRFDPTFGKSFEAFAIPTIIGEIKRFLRDKTWDVHVPRRIKELGSRIKRAHEVLTTDFQRPPSISEIAEYLDVVEEDVLEAMELGRSYQALSMDRSIEINPNSSTVTLFDVIGKEDEGFEMANRRIIVEDAMDMLNAREKEIIQLTYLEQLSQKEAGERLGISQMHVSRIQRKAIKKLQEAILSSGSLSI